MPRGEVAAGDDAERGADGVRWDALVARHDRRVTVSLLAMGFGIEEAKEIVQETWIRLIEQWRSGRLDELRLPGLAIRQARFLALELRRRGRREDPMATLPEVGDERQRIEQTVDGRRALARAEAALAACSPRAQQIFRLVYGPRSLSPLLVAAELGLSVQRVRQSVTEVRARLRAALENDDG